ncbi:hypothetical protein LCGC14_1815940, partial [marine sediment metagenome]
MAREFTADTSDRIEADNSLNPGGSLTICSWVKLTSTGNNKRLCANRASGSTGYIIDTGTGVATLRFLIAIGGSFRTANGTTAVNDGNWHFVVGVYTAAATDVVEFFVNDMETPEGTSSGTFGTYNNA